MSTKLRSSLLLAISFAFTLSASAEIYYSPFPSIEISQPSEIESPSKIFQASDTALPPSLYEKLLSRIANYKFTVLPERDLERIFDDLALDPKARMEDAGGNCAVRRSYIQELLKERSIISGQLYVSCNFSKGSLKLLDRATNNYRIYVNFHDVNVFAVQTEKGEIDYRVVDVQFSDRPVTLGEYLGEVEASQKLKPKNKKAKSKLDTKNCFWELNSETYGFFSASK